MKKRAIGLLLVMAGIAALGLVTLPALTHTASAATASIGSLAKHGFAVGSSSSSTDGPSGTSGGIIAICSKFIAIRGTCSESGP
jgi:hypothetical protein